MLIARIFPRPFGARKNTTQLAKYPRVLYVKPSNKIYIFTRVLVLKNISLVRCAHSWNIFQHSKRNFVSPRGHVISSIHTIELLPVLVKNDWSKGENNSSTSRLSSFQVTKLAISGRVVDEQQIERHFTAADLCELYTFNPDILAEDKAAEAGKETERGKETEAGKDNEGSKETEAGKEQDGEKDTGATTEAGGGKETGATTEGGAGKDDSGPSKEADAEKDSEAAKDTEAPKEAPERPTLPLPKVRSCKENNIH